MNIENISKEKGEVLVRLSKDNLVVICNALYRQTQENKENILQLYSDMMMARDLCQYGHVDNFCLHNIVKCRSELRGLLSEDDIEVKDAQNSTLGTKITSNEAHYFYPFVINPLAYKELVDLDVTEGYTEEDYQNFKRTALVSATAFATNSKVGCENEFAVFVETESDAYLPNLSEYVTFAKCEDKNIIDLKKLANILKDMSQQIKSVEIYYNPYTTELTNDDIKAAKHFNIITSKEV